MDKEYEIKPYSYEQADRLGVYITHSNKKNKKFTLNKQQEYIDIF